MIRVGKCMIPMGRCIITIGCEIFDESIVRSRAIYLANFVRVNSTRASVRFYTYL
jgi:hypothetical protein